MCALWCSFQVAVTISEIASVLGLIFALVGTALGVFNYLRDQGKPLFRLQWDMSMTGEDAKKKVGCITVTNTRRRAGYMSDVALRLPNGPGISHFLIRDGLRGQKLSEGDPPAAFPVDQSDPEPYATVKDRKFLHRSVTLLERSGPPNPPLRCPCVPRPLTTRSRGTRATGSHVRHRERSAPQT